LGALDPEERLLFEDHLRAGCSQCEEELRGLQEITDVFADAVAADPPPKLRRRLLAEVSRSPRMEESLPEGILVARSATLPWKPMAQGIEYKVLHSDRIRRYSTALIRMQPGTTMPRHRHGDIEELYMLSGDLRVSGAVVRAGDYCRADTNSVHEAAFSETGCTFLLMASQDNQFVASV
jgi:anti-sigma factor ChrR (cupin superfamily)